MNDFHQDTASWQRRWHPLLGEWVLIAANTQQRPVTQGNPEIKPAELPEYDKSCYLCPGNQRASGKINPDYQQVYVFENDFPTLSAHAPDINEEHGLEKISHLKGECRVVCYDPHHNKSLAALSLEKISEVFSQLQKQFDELSKIKHIENIIIFENKGKETGASNPHPHGQIYATPFVLKNTQCHVNNFSAYEQAHKRCLLCDLIEQEKKESRIVLENHDFIAFVPFFARFAYETMIVPKSHHENISGFSESQLTSLADIYQKLMKTYDRLFGFPFPNIISWINSPVNQETTVPFHCYLSFCPPMRSATQLKYLAGIESAGGNIVNPVQPETAAQQLKEASNK